jgi:hypothetical protein
VTEEKICLWLQEDVLNWRTLVPRPQLKGALGKRKRGSRAAAHAALEPLLFRTTEEEDLAAIAA